MDASRYYQDRPVLKVVRTEGPTEKEILRRMAGGLVCRDCRSPTPATVLQENHGRCTSCHMETPA